MENDFEVQRLRRNVAAKVSFSLSLSDLSGGGYYWVSERPARLTTAARLC
jgi:hypothetical protein